MINSNVIMYDAALTPCPFCGGAEQEITGVWIGSPGKEWSWRVECKQCHATFACKNSEREVIDAWNRRFSKDDIEEDGYITWKRFRDRYVRELTDNINGRYDRAD